MCVLALGTTLAPAFTQKKKKKKKPRRWDRAATPLFSHSKAPWVLHRRVRWIEKKGAKPLSQTALLGCEYKEIDRRLSSCPPIVQLLSFSTRSRHFHQPVSTICRPDLKLMTTAAATCSSRQQSAVNHQKVPQLLRLLVSSPARKFWYVHFIISKSTCNLRIIGFLIHAESRYT